MSMATTGIGARLADLGETALAPLSFVFYRGTRFGVQRLVQLHGRMRPAQATTWRTLNADEVRRPLHLLALMTSAPRWNTHAIIALAGPLHVQRQITIHAATAASSARSWSLVVHREPSHRIVASVGSLDTCAQGPWCAVNLPPGTYRLAMRYYWWSSPVELPEVEVDGAAVVPPLLLPASTNDFYRDLAARGGFLYSCLHAYVRALLRHRRWFPSAFVEREYLPAGNPQTTFQYGSVRAGTRLAIDLDPRLWRTSDVYLTVYNRASFPVLSERLTGPGQEMPRVDVDGTYLVRVHARTER
jgi:hypothetical protein